MTDILLGIVFLLITISLLVLAHEGGHYLAARWCGMRVEDFSLFFGPVIARLGQRGATRFHLRAIPFGGFVRIAGMEPEDVAAGMPVLRTLQQAFSSSHPDAVDRTLRQLARDNLLKLDPKDVSIVVREAIAGAIGSDARLTDEGAAQLQMLRQAEHISESEARLIDLLLNAHARKADPELFIAKPLYQRAAVIVAGPVASLLFGYVIFSMMGITVGLPTSDSRITNQVADVVPGGEASRVGIRPGDWIIALDGKPVRDGKDLVDQIHGRIGVPTRITVRRRSRTFEALVMPKPREFTDENGRKVTWGVIGIVANPELRRVGVLESIRVGTFSTYASVRQMIEVLSDRRQVRENVGGPIAMGKMATDVQRLGIGPMLLLGAQFSISLFVLNLLPIPVLDGGQLLLLAAELVRRRKLSPREVYGAQAVGLGIIVLLILAVTYNDILRLVRG